MRLLVAEDPSSAPPRIDGVVSLGRGPADRARVLRTAGIRRRGDRVDGAVTALVTAPGPRLVRGNGLHGHLDI